ncbi:MAG: ATP-binding protein [Mariprofundales bacterium]|nr:ATP-binding protein [Mariprofundales bacterium]
MVEMFFHLGVMVALALLAGMAWGRFGRNYRRRIRQLKQDNQQLVQYKMDADGMLEVMRDVVVVLDRQGRVLQANTKARRLFAFESTIAGTLGWSGEVAGEVAGEDELISITQLSWGAQWQQQIEEALARLPAASHFPPLDIAYNGGSRMVLTPELVALGDDRALLFGSDISQSVDQAREKEALFANLMHDFKTPLTNLIGYSNTLETMGDDPDIRQHASGAIGRAAKRVNRLLDALLALHSEGDASEVEHCDLAVAIDLMREGVCDQAEAAQVVVKVKLPQSPIMVAMPIAACERVLTNVVENAVAYSPAKGKVRLTISLQLGAVVLRVSDQGNGVSQEEIAYLTERFYRADAARGDHGGHGLGLAIVDKLLRQFDGSIAISNRLPSGLQVEMRIPLA